MFLIALLAFFAQASLTSGECNVASAPQPFCGYTQEGRPIYQLSSAQLQQLPPSLLGQSFVRYGANNPTDLNGVAAALAASTTRNYLDLVAFGASTLGFFIMTYAYTQSAPKGGASKESLKNAVTLGSLAIPLGTWFVIGYDTLEGYGY